MEQLQKAMRSHRLVSCALTFGAVIFYNCFGFPIYNLTKEWPFFITAEYVFLGISAAVIAGGFLAGLFPQKRLYFIVPLTLFLSLAGLGCRYLLEFGEVSNTHNFTPSNIALHLIVFTVISAFTWSEQINRT